MKILNMLIDLLPQSIAVLLPELSLLLIGYVVEKHYVSRVTCFTNVLALNVHFLTIGESGLWLGLYADLGLVLGGWGFYRYWKQRSLDTWYYEVSHLGYSSLVVGAIILYPYIKWVFSAILGDGSVPAIGLIVFAVLVNTALLDEASSLHYTLSQPVGVNEFIRTSRIRIPTEKGWSDFIELNQWFDTK